MQNKLILRPVIKLQDRSTKILKENTKWELKVTKLNDLRKEDFINTIKTLNMNSKVDRSRFHNTLNWIFKFKVKGKIAKGIKTEEGIIHGREKDKLIKIYFEKLFAANTTKIEIRNNAIFNYEYDIKRAISSISRSKAVGINGITSKALVQEIKSPLMIKIEKWFKEWIIKGEIPDYLTQGRLILISKDNTKNPVINDTRPVTILPAITKFFETTILHNLEKATKSIIFNKNQRGFTKGKSILDNIRDVISIANELKRSKTTNSPALVFYDFIKAYDSVPRDKLIAKLQTFEIPWNIIKLTDSMLSKFKLKAGSEIIQTHRGLIQGSVLSPILFSLYINDLLIQYTLEGIDTSAYANDIVWMWNSKEQTSRAILIMKNWWSQNEMKINEKKSGIFRILKRTGKIKNMENALNIPEVNSYKYLGVWINQSIKVGEHCNYNKSKVTNLKRKIGLLKPSLVGMNNRLPIYKTIVKPQLSYAWSTLFENSSIGQKRLNSALYQWLKSLISIRGNVSRVKLLETLKMDKPYNLIVSLTIKVIKLRIGWLFSHHKERLWKCSHIINSEEIVGICSKMKEWRMKWSQEAKILGFRLETALLKITQHNERKSNIKTQTIK